MQMQEDMVRTIEQHVRDTAAEIGRDELSPRLIAALRKVPRARFVPPGEERPLSRDGVTDDWAWCTADDPVGTE